MERGALFRHFCVSKVITTAHAHKSGVIFHIFPRSFKQKTIKALSLKDRSIPDLPTDDGVERRNVLKSLPSIYPGHLPSI